MGLVLWVNTLSAASDTSKSYECRFEFHGLHFQIRSLLMSLRKKKMAQGLGFLPPMRETLIQFGAGPVSAIMATWGVAQQMEDCL